MLDFAAGEDSELRCSSELSCSASPAECPGWTGLNSTATEPTTFRVRIGISGGIRGYQSITGNDLKCISIVLLCIHTRNFFSSRIIRLGHSLLH